MKTRLAALLATPLLLTSCQTAMVMAGSTIAATLLEHALDKGDEETNPKEVPVFFPGGYYMSESAAAGALPPDSRKKSFARVE